VVLDADAYREQRHAVRRWSTLVIFLVALALGATTYTQFQIRNTQTESTARGKAIAQNVHDVKHILQILTDATSPEARERAAAQLRAAIEAIGCDNRAALQDLIDQLVEQGILRPGDLRIACLSTTTTTSTP
jgi:hypothetical protein